MRSSFFPNYLYILDWRLTLAVSNKVIQGWLSCSIRSTTLKLLQLGGLPTSHWQNTPWWQWVLVPRIICYSTARYKISSIYKHIYIYTCYSDESSDLATTGQLIIATKTENQSPQFRSGQRGYFYEPTRKVGSGVERATCRNMVFLPNRPCDCGGVCNSGATIM